MLVVVFHIVTEYLPKKETYMQMKANWAHCELKFEIGVAAPQADTMY